ncbi:MAG: sensor histidine kinase [Blastocatellia bacterium]
MNFPLVISVSLLFVAFFWSIRLAWRERDWQIGLLAAAMGFIAIRRLLIATYGTPFIFGPGPFAEIPGLLLGGVTLAAIVALDRTINERRRTERRLKNSHQRLRELAVRLHTIREEERARISREMHDEIGQVLTGLKIEIKLFGKEVQTSHQHLLPRTQEMLELVDRTMLVIRDIATELRPSVLDTLGLLAAIEWQAETFQNRTGIQCRIISDLGNEKLDGDMETNVFRIFQESLTNVIRHSEATEVEIELIRNDGKLVLTVCDNGKGISADAMNKPHTLGILGMRERALPFNGEVSISNAHEGGTVVSLSVPLHSAIQSET